MLKEHTQKVKHKSHKMRRKKKEMGHVVQCLGLRPRGEGDDSLYQKFDGRALDKEMVHYILNLLEEH